MRLNLLLILLLIFLAAGHTGPAAAQTAPETAKLGTLENPKIKEASGLARSTRDPNLFWVISDGGPSVLHAIDKTGARRGRVKIKKAHNRNWEDLASFQLDGVAYLMIADTGDNNAKRDEVRLYVVEEPDPDKKKN